ncbi:hypothetical protein COK81_15895 [Bacillus thuringiensis]|uniref:Crystaline entomocidal protoxin n=2 Tax=Bacillus thuringiensis TaxID=1428 RepID=A0A9X7AZP5_BACTU|nr:hypothetical protein COK81_15895 [Bacillus thuringiensis]
MFYKTVLDHADQMKIPADERNLYRNALIAKIKSASSQVYTYFKQVRYTDDATRVVTRQTLYTHCLDYVAMWPTFNPDLYPVSADLEQTRVLSSPITGPTTNGAPHGPFSDGLGFDSHLELTNISYWQGDRVDYVNQNFQNGSSISGGSGNGGTRHDVPSSRANPIASAWLNVPENNYQFFQYQMYNTPIDYTKPQNPFLAPPGHKLHRLYLASDPSFGGRVGNSMALFIQDSIFPENIIGKVDTDLGVTRIKGIPFEKSPSTSTFTYNSEPLNGAEAVKLGVGQSLALPITNVATGSYEVRIRYASTTAATIFINLDVGGGHPIYKTVVLPATSINDSTGIEGANGTYALFKIQAADIPAGNFNVYVTNVNGANLFLDRIEFVRAGPSGSGNADDIPDTPFDLTNTIPQTIWKGNNTNNHLTSLNGVVTTDTVVNIALRLQGSFVGNSKYYSKGSFDFVRDYGSDIQYLQFDEITLAAAAWGAEVKGTIRGQVNISAKSFNTEEDLATITQVVNTLFITDTQLAPTATDYWIDQVYLKVKALSDDMFGEEKDKLRQRVARAKQINMMKNKLVGSSFQSVTHWQFSSDVALLADNPLFAGKYVVLPPSTYPDTRPSYAYQKVDESKLKPYTRYIVRGFIGQAQDLALMVSRYGKEIDTTLTVPYQEALPVSPGSEIYEQEYTQEEMKRLEGIADALNKITNQCWWLLK